MNEQAFFHWDLIRQPLQPPTFGMGASLLDFSILELRKEKSRDAARSRRGKENYEFYELAKLLPLPAAITSQLDKASIIRLSISYLKLREFSGHGDPPWNRDLLINNKSLKGPGRRRNSMSVAMDIFDSHQGTHILQSVDGFAFILANDGRFLYISETVSVYLGLSQVSHMKEVGLTLCHVCQVLAWHLRIQHTQVEMTGSYIFDYVHTQDHQELVDQLGLGISHSSTCNIPSPGSQSDDGSSPQASSPITPERTSYMIPNPEKGFERSFCLRMKSTLTKRGVHVRTSGYRVVYVLGHMRPQMCVSLNRKSPTHLLGMVGMAIALPPPTITELRIESDTFIMRLNPDFSITYCDPLISELTDWSSEDMTGRMLYEVCHAGDLYKFRKVHQDLLTKGQVLSDYYRLMNKNGGYVWVQMCATTLYSSKTSDVHTVLAIFYVLSGVEFSGCVMDQNQLPKGEKMESDPSDHSEQGSDIGDKDGVNKVLQSPRDDVSDCSVPSNSSQNPPDRKTETTETNKQTTEADVSKTALQELNDIDFEEKSHVTSQEEKAEVIVSNLEAKIKELKSDYKNSRRKTDRPRKRRREIHSDSIDSEPIMTNQWCSKMNIPKDDLDVRLHGGGMNCDGNIVSISMQSDSSNSSSPITENCGHGIPLPEDLSLRSINVCPASIGRSTSHSVSMSQQHAHCWNSPGNNLNNNNDTTLSSVKDIEDAMCKHLSNVQNQQNAGIISKPMSSISEMSSRYVGLPNTQQKSRSAIQWTGNNRGGGETLPASNLLRTLYANRESVIRSSNRQQCFSNDKSSLNMLTPPGSDGLKDSLTLNIPHINVGEKEPVLLPYDNSDHICSVSVANSLSDSFNMTPPSSVSPDDKAASPFVVERSFDPSSVITCSLPMSTSTANSVKSQVFSLSLASPTVEFDASKTTGCHNINTPSYPMTDYSQYLHNTNTVVYDTRQDPWYSSVSFSS